MNPTQLTTTNIKAFTLVETLVSVFILTMIIIGPLTVASNASMYAKLTKDTVTATYLAEESLELLRHQQDSVYIRCSNRSTQCVTTGTETPDQAAWRIFKARLGMTSQGPSCYTSDNTAGCSYDFLDMTGNEDSNPSKYLSTDPACSLLSYDPANRVYVCTGVRGAGLTQTNFSRSVQITSIPTFSGTDASYNDDLRVVVIVKFTRASGYVRQVKIIDFLHARA